MVSWRGGGIDTVEAWLSEDLGVAPKGIRTRLNGSGTGGIDK